MSSYLSEEENYGKSQEEVEEKGEGKLSLLAKYFVLYIYSKCCMLMSTFWWKDCNVARD